MGCHQLLKWLVQISRFGLAALWLFAFSAKLFIFKEFAGNISELVGTSWAWPITVAVISAELIAAALLIAPRTVCLGGFWSGMLLAGFAGFALYYVYVLHGEPLECGCFGGIIASQLGIKTGLRNLALLVPCMFIIFGVPHLRDSGSQSPQE